MKKLDQEYLQKLKKIVSEIKCDYAEIRAAIGSNNSIVLSGKQVESVSSGVSQGGSIRILENGTWSFLSFNKIEDIERYAEKSQSLAKQVSVAEKTEIIKSKPVKIDQKTKCKRDLNQIDFDEKFELISAYNNILQSAKQIQTTQAVYRDTESTRIYVNSEGSEAVYEKSHCGVGLTAIAKDGKIIQPYTDSIAGYGGYELVTGLEQKAEEVVKNAVDLLSAEELDGGTYDVILDQKLAGVFIHEAFGHLSEADFVYENERMRKIMTLGAKFGNDDLAVIDDGNLNETGYIPIDDEGILPEKTYLIKKGELVGRLHSRETAAKMNEKPTGNARSISVMQQPLVRMTNTYIDNGPDSREDLFKNMEDGLYAVSYRGGQTNLEMFTFSPVFVYKIKNGERKGIYKNVILSGNVFETLKNVKMIANDRMMFGGLGGCGKGGQFPLPVSFGGPHMLIENVLVGGAQ